MQGRTARATLPAMLMTPDNRVLEVGSARVSAENQSVDFLGGFIQLFRMDTPLKVVITERDTPVQSFSGKVYLSSQTLLRLVEVREKIYVGAKKVCFFDTALEGVLHVQPEERPRRLFLPRRHTDGPETLAAAISRISLGGVNFTAGRPLGRGQPVGLDIPALEVRGLELRVETAFEFGQEQRRNYHCSIRQIPPEALEPLDRLVTALCNAQLRVFT